MSDHAPERKRPEITLSRLPPLAALRAFTAAARHLSFIRAAEELHVTSAAVSQHVRQLETHFAQPLFIRNRGRLALTEAGSILFPGLEQAFDAVLESVKQVDRPDGSVEMRIAAPSSFISKWLLPRMTDLRRAIPNVRIVFDPVEVSTLSEHWHADCAINASHEGAAGPDAEYLFQEELVPVCTPSYQLRHGVHAGDFCLDRVTLLGEQRQDRDSRYPGWQRWLRANLPRRRVQPQQISFSDPATVIDAALLGQGIALASIRLAQADLAAGRLVVPFGTPQRAPDAYFFSTLRPASGHVVAFRQWLNDEASAVRGHTAGLGDGTSSFLIAAE